MSDKMLCLRLDAELHRRLKVKLATQEKTLQDLIAELVIKYLKEVGKK